jgi:hypothetical protein
MEKRRVTSEQARQFVTNVSLFVVVVILAVLIWFPKACSCGKEDVEKITIGHALVIGEMEKRK